ncbi:MAG: type II toxin-antitoxin system VapB family antitoxin [Gammaproteobacteria bacterium]|nr:type II toxin-antitoxin system VapB family antitoxin [Gammaproteobacteria bacterium]
MRTNIILDDQLVNESFLLTSIKTKREFVDHRKRLDLRDLKGICGLADDQDKNITLLIMP